MHEQIFLLFVKKSFICAVRVMLVMFGVSSTTERLNSLLFLWKTNLVKILINLFGIWGPALCKKILSAPITDRELCENLLDLTRFYSRSLWVSKQTSCAIHWNIKRCLLKIKLKAILLESGESWSNRHKIMLSLFFELLKEDLGSAGPQTQHLVQG